MFNLHVVSRLIDDGNLPTAISLLTEITRNVPIYVTPFVMLARAYEASGNRQGALVTWRSAQNLVPKSRVISKGVNRNQPVALPHARSRRPLPPSKRPIIIREDTAMAVGGVVADNIDSPPLSDTRQLGEFEGVEFRSVVTGEGRELEGVKKVQDVEKVENRDLHLDETAVRDVKTEVQEPEPVIIDQPGSVLLTADDEIGSYERPLGTESSVDSSVEEVNATILEDVGSKLFMLEVDDSPTSELLVSDVEEAEIVTSFDDHLVDDTFVDVESKMEEVPILLEPVDQSLVLDPSDENDLGSEFLHSPPDEIVREEIEILAADTLVVPPLSSPDVAVVTSTPSGIHIDNSLSAEDLLGGEFQNIPIEDESDPLKWEKDDVLAPMDFGIRSSNKSEDLEAEDLLGGEFLSINLEQVAGEILNWDEGNSGFDQNIESAEPAHEEDNHDKYKPNFARPIDDTSPFSFLDDESPVGMKDAEINDSELAAESPTAEAPLNIMDMVKEDPPLEKLVEEFFESSQADVGMSVGADPPYLLEEDSISNEDEDQGPISIPAPGLSLKTSELDQLIADLESVRDEPTQVRHQSQTKKNELSSDVTGASESEATKEEDPDLRSEKDDVKMAEVIEEDPSPIQFLDPIKELRELPPPKLESNTIKLDNSSSLSEDLLAQDEVVSETLARIYISQKKYLEASRVYKLLAEQNPEREGAFKERAKELRVMAAELDE